jgi:diguanylate cyclase (GGDEF)-like protein
MRYPRYYLLGYFCLASTYVVLATQILPRAYPVSFPHQASHFGWLFVLLSSLYWLLALYSETQRQRRLQSRLEDDAGHDALTGLINRRAFIDILEAAIHRSTRHRTRLGLAFIDLDGFKQINDLYGHIAGDQLLLAVSARLTQTIRKGDIVARMGGDEFVVLVEPDQNEGSEILAQRLTEAFRQPFQIAGKSLAVTMSIGLAFAPEHAREAELLIRCADMAMYRVKNTGRNSYALAEANGKQQMPAVLKPEAQPQPIKER